MMESLLKPVEEKKPKKYDIYFLLLGGVILFISGYMYIVKDVFSTLDQSNETTQQPTGTLYASMGEINKPLAIYSYEVQEETTAPFISRIALEGATTMQYESTHDSKAFFVFSPVAPDPVTGQRSSNIMMVDGVAQSTRLVMSTSSTLTGYRNLDYSEENDLLTFTAKESAAGISAVPESVDAWGVYVVDPETQLVELIGKGIDAVWSPDGTSLVYLGSNGIKQHTLSSKTTRDVALPGFTKEVKAGTNMNLDVSPDGTLLAITSPNDSLLSLFEISAWQELILVKSEKYQSIIQKNTTFYWPTFSPDSKFIAVQVADIDANQNQINPRIEILRLKDMQTVRLIPIDKFDFQRAFIDGWEAN